MLNHTQTSFIQLRNIEKTYQAPAGAVTVLKQINLDIQQGEFVALVGKSGSGKSTLLNILTGIDTPSAGDISIAKIMVNKLGPQQLIRWRGTTIGIVFQFFQLLPALTLKENVMLPMDFCNMYSQRERAERACMLLEKVGLGKQINSLPNAVSGGQQQRAAIARALANDPPIVVADEPTGNLDSQTALAIYHIFEELCASGKTLLMVTHDQELAQRASRTIQIVDGRIMHEEQVYV